MASKFQFITELYSRTLTRLTGDYESWTGFLRSACYNYKCPFDEQVLIYAQRPDATAVLELEKWNRQFGRWVNAGATGIAVMDEVHGKGRLKHYFDITDTHATRISRPVPIWSMEPAYTEPVIETLEATFGTLAEKDNLPDAILSASRNAVADNMQDYLRDLLDCRDGSMLEELDALNVEVTYRRALESSVAYMLLTRLSLPAAAYILPEDFEGIYSFDSNANLLHSEGGSKKYVGIAKALFAYAIQISLDAGFDGVLIFKAKTSELLSYYMEKFGARQVASYDPYRLVIWEDAAEDILSTFTMEVRDNGSERA